MSDDGAPVAGQFPICEASIERLGLSERGFLQLRRRDELREQLTSALVDGVVAVVIDPHRAAKLVCIGVYVGVGNGV